MNVVIVESPAKAKTINKYLGKDYEVFASFGHVRDLPPKDGSVDPDHDFAMLWDVDTKSAKRLADIAKAVKEADRVILATDPDREGEAISWHVLEVLKAKKVLKDKPVERVVFNAITQSAILDAMRHPRAIDIDLVDAYLARRALDYLVGFNLSPVLWRKLPGARSAGRVQSVALRLVCERELEIERFVPREYWSLTAFLRTPADQPFSAKLVGADGKKINRLDIGAGAEAEAFKAALETAKFTVAKVEAKPARRNPAPPFTTSTLQQEAARKLGLAPARTMQLAQRLYEGIDLDGETVGLITYMRTDGVDLAPEAITGARKVIAAEYGDKYVPQAPRRYQVKAKNAQEAHEAIRPTDLARLPKHVARFLDAEQARLYDLIWTRTIASQMESAELERTTVDILAEVGARRLDLRATGQVVRFDGFLKLYQEGRDDEEDEEGGRLPAMQVGDPLKKDRIEASQHFTEPPPRFTEATLVKRMEELGIGRPSTYASTLAVLKDREYVRIDKKRLIPEDKGRLVTAFLESFFGRYVGYDFTADLESSLDKISNHEIDWKQVLRDFWADFSGAIADTKDLRTTQVLDSLNEVLGPYIFPDKGDGSNPRACPSCANGQLSLKLGKFGSFIGCSNYPECKFTRTLSDTGPEGGNGETDRPGVKVLGVDAETGEEISLRDGRFGAYVQRGEGEKPKRASLPKTIAPADLTLDMALGLLSLPREVARHPETHEPILAGIGRFGPYVQHGKTYANIGKDEDILTLGANRAIDLIIAKESGLTGRRFGKGESAPARVLGDHPEGGQVTIKAGRFGPYVNYGKLNATLPKDADPTTLTLEEGLALLAAKASGQGGGKGAVQGQLLGEHPSGGPITVREGRFGPYVNHGKVNATLKSGLSPETLTLEEAIRLIDEKAGAASKKAPAKKAPAKKASGKTTTTEKAPAKKAASKAATAKTTKAKAAKSSEPDEEPPF
ncbi:type I DNA topoisomerase [Beijerinckia indica]|uniref:DNA topoisomerase 1 n=1 Tax=Beijerinckia indica subsp. indica (strain ATCC 9039 / DSM 1715 / NCIMB 8712) TaxID=395963 RepID=B2IEN4_BEII9|nr:type I DNA topoisomerase [Beijerinckia indica]ACB96974.1 DNA topoisomerase I [Beijerinckia indica subsp. indica ATCC 9039]